MLFQGAFHIFLHLHIASIAVALPPNPSLMNSYLPNLSLPREENQTINEDQIYPPGYIHRYITLREGVNAITVPVVEAELPNLEDGHQSRSMATPGNCKTWTPRKGICFIIYCWFDNTGTLRTGYIAIMPGNNGKTPGSSDPIEMVSSNMNIISLNYDHNTGTNHWFAKNHACKNDNTITYTNHYLSDSTTGVAFVDHLQCDTCIFQDFGCLVSTGFSGANYAVAWSSRSAVEFSCILK